MITEHQYDDAKETINAYKNLKKGMIDFFPISINGEKLLNDELLHAHECFEQIMDDAFHRILKDARMTLELANRADTRDEEREHATVGR